MAEFIAEVEQEPLFAPAYLKEEILKSLEKQDINSLHKLRQSKIQMYTYSLKITAGMAAALLLLFILPQIPQEYRWPLRTARSWEAALEKEPRNLWEEELKTTAEDPWAKARKEPLPVSWAQETGGLSHALQNGTEAINSVSTTIYNSIMSINQLFNQEESNYETKQEE